MNILDKFKRTKGCWVWEGPITPTGYGNAWMKVDGRWTSTSAHRAVYELLVGPVPKGMVLDHKKCSNPPCVNPAHMEVCTQKENIARAHNFNRDKTCCKYGHEFTPENTYYRRDRPGRRECLTCRNARNALRYAA